MKSFRTFRKDINESNPVYFVEEMGGGDGGGGDSAPANRSGSKIAGTTKESEPGRKKDKRFAGCKVFKVEGKMVDSCVHGKGKYQRWSRIIDMNSPSGRQIYEYAVKNPKDGIILEDDKTGAMVYLKRRV